MRLFKTDPPTPLLGQCERFENKCPGFFRYEMVCVCGVGGGGDIWNGVSTCGPSVPKVSGSGGRIHPA